MIKIEIKEGEHIDRALKRYKRKHRNVQLMKNIRANEFFTKKSVKRRKIIQKASYVQKMKDEQEY